MINHKIKTVEVLQIAAGLAAALRWAISFMPLDGVRFSLSGNGIFEAASFIMSLAFVAVEVGATAYMMRAWRKEQDAKTRKALAALWVSALALTVFAQVPPLLANINSQGVNEYPFWFQAAWVTASVAVTFVTIGGLGYSEKSLEAPQVNASKAEVPALLRLESTQATLDHVPSRSLTDVDLLKLWRAHGQADAWEQVKDIASECLNGNTPRLQAWYGDKRSIAGLVSALGQDEAQGKRTAALVRGLIKPQVCTETED